MERESPGLLADSAASSASPSPAAAELQPTPPATIVITQPSSPDDSPNLSQPSLSLASVRALEVRTLSDVTTRLGAPVDPLPSTATARPTSLSATTPATPMSAFEQRLAATTMPPPGPDYFAVRRSLWRAPLPNHPAQAEPSSSRMRLESLLSEPGALEDDLTWGSGLDKVWHGLVGGAKLRQRLPLALVVKLLQAGWIREGTWPRGAIAPASDDEHHVSVETAQQQFMTTDNTATETTPTAASPPAHTTDAPKT
ncbi:hypothetical protein BD413DRAFT_548138 [Trametes elegans]|nr:hypothetical protein BD413DRAFT_548138 [Trametes elegans]